MTDLVESPVFVATVMMAALGALTACFLRLFQLKSIRLQTILVAAVLVQGVMIVRLPIHLGFWPADHTEAAQHVYTQAMAQASLDSVDVASAAALAETTTALVGQPDHATVVSSNNLEPTVLLSPIPLRDAIVGCWLLGVIFIVGLAVFRYRRLVRLLGALRPAEEAFQDEWRETLSDVGLSENACPLLVSQSVGPMVVRTPRSYVMVVPSEYWQSLSSIQRRAVMIHEAQHLWRRDVWRQLAARTVAALHWFNPVGWWAARRLDAAAELACDAAVGKRGAAYSAGFASALVALVSHTDPSSKDASASLGCFAMAAPPLTNRIKHLLQPSAPRDSFMKRTAFVMVAGLVGLASCFQFHLTAADTDSPNANSDARRDSLRVIAAEATEQLERLAATMDTSDDHTAQFVKLMDTTGGKMAISSYMDQLRGNAIREARSDAMAKFIEYRFETTDDGLVLKDADVAQRWRKKSERFSESIESLNDASGEIAREIENDKSDVAMLMKRFLKDSQSSVALLMADTKAGGDPISAFISKALGKILVQRRDGKFQVFDSAREKASELVKRFELADAIAKRLGRQFPVFAADMDGDYEPQKVVIEYLKEPVTAQIVALHLSEKPNGSASELVEKMFESLEGECDDTATGLQMRAGDAMNQVKEIFRLVDRAKSGSHRVKERLLEIADAMADDELSQKLAQLARGNTLPLLLAAEIPYADNMAGDQFRAQLDEVLTESGDGGLKIRKDRAEELAGQLKGLLQTCRQIRRHTVTVEEILEQMADHDLVSDLGDKGKYVLLNQIRNHAMSHQVDAIELLKADLVEPAGDSKVRVRPQKRDLVDKLVQAARGLNERSEADDF